MAIDPHRVKSLLEGALEVTDALSGGTSLNDIRTNKLNKNLKSALPEMINGVSRAELLRLVWLSTDYVTRGRDEALHSACELGQQFQRGIVGPIQS